MAIAALLVYPSPGGLVPWACVCIGGPGRGACVTCHASELRKLSLHGRPVRNLAFRTGRRGRPAHPLGLAAATARADVH
ncbi:hypothetical protein CBM2621_B100193 [Cupriavidus taiwanensis]|nr:hypothetical protein CBM2622_B110194 [Cupriavidus taiwanensis]SOZ93285.1 hypothetical protein CBM2621_B100193 [Cupriavidus taiwanensis]